MNERGLGAAGFALAIAAHGLLLLLLYINVQRAPKPAVSISAALWTSRTISAAPAQQSQPVREELLDRSVASPEPPLVSESLKPQRKSSERPDIRVERRPEAKRVPRPPTATRAPLALKVPKLQKKPVDNQAVQRPSETLSRLKQEAAAEGMQRSASAKAETKALAEYQRLVAEQVRQLIVFDEFGSQNYEAQFEVSVLPTREILEVRVVRGSRNPAYDAAVERALKALRQLPLPPAGVRLERVNGFYFRLKE